MRLVVVVQASLSDGERLPRWAAFDDDARQMMRLLHFRPPHTLLRREPQFDLPMTHREPDDTCVGGEGE